MIGLRTRLRELEAEAAAAQDAAQALPLDHAKTCASKLVVPVAMFLLTL